MPYFNTPLGPLGRDLRRHGCTAILCQDYEHARFDLAVILGARLGLPVIASYQGGDRPFSGLEGAICRRSLKRVGGLILRACREAERVAPLSAKRLEELADDRII